MGTRRIRNVIQVTPCNVTLSRVELQALRLARHRENQILNVASNLHCRLCSTHHLVNTFHQFSQV